MVLCATSTGGFLVSIVKHAGQNARCSKDRMECIFAEPKDVYPGYHAYDHKDVNNRHKSGGSENDTQNLSCCSPSVVIEGIFCGTDCHCQRQE
mmetsp:Transcript_29263/g.57000  ORF Transcript_29263/g.57000 Transcript_29263/m.57000 type:complete len:93 (-) Transcript_29263:703-981(-)